MVPTAVSDATVAAFEATLRAEGFTEVDARDYAPGTCNAEHTHPFDVKALMLSGELTLGCGPDTATYRTGDVFTLAAHRVHTEQFGAEPTRYLVGRRHPA